MKSIQLKKGKENLLQRKHPWIFSGAIVVYEDVKEGDYVTLFQGKQAVATGFFSSGSIALRVLYWGKEPMKVEELIQQKIENAINYRKSMGFFDFVDTNCFRLVFGEGDGLPGLIIDYYAGYAVIQCHSWGMYYHKEFIYKALKSSLEDKLKGIYDKSADSLHSSAIQNQWIEGETAEIVALEYGNSFHIDPIGGQKTGFFIDQRENRRLLGEHSKGKKVLNTFSYSGGFSIYALKASAKEVVSVDISKSAIELANKNAELNRLSDRHIGIAEDVFSYLKNMDSDFDIIVLDPPAFAKSHKVTHNAVMGYKRINSMAIQKMKPGALLFTFSCSQNISTELFYNTVVSAAMEVGVEMRLVQQLTQPTDHPVSIFHPEGQYLKGFVLQKI